MTEQWQREKADMGRVKDYKEEIERVNIEIAQAERDYDLNRWVGGWRPWGAAVCGCVWGEKFELGRDGTGACAGVEWAGCGPPRGEGGGEVWKNRGRVLSPTSSGCCGGTHTHHAPLAHTPLPVPAPPAPFPSAHYYCC